MTAPSKSDAPGPEESGGLLIVDDTAANLQLLTRVLGAAGFRVRPVASGEAALAAARSEAPDLVLLDVDMPEMDGYEVCRRLKADPELAEIPVLFLSALGETEDKLAAFAAGGVDYVTKPFRVEELRARIATHLEMRRLQRALETRNRELDASYHKLRELERLRHDLIHMLAHDMRSPLMGISGYLELLEIDREILSQDHRDFVARALDATRTLVRHVDAMLDVDRLESSRVPIVAAEHDLRRLVERAIAALGPIGASRVTWRPESDPSRLARCDAELVTRVVGNLISNALIYSDEDQTVEVAIRPGENGAARVEVRDRGPGVPPDLRPRLFEKYVARGVARGRTRSMGLGLAFCRLAVEAHGGRIGFDSPEGGGATFWFELPPAGPHPDS
jgi:signal transduction histidine kinase